MKKGRAGMLVVVDANVIVKDSLLRDRKWQVASEAIAAERLRLVLPEVARLEAVGGFRRAHEEKLRQIRSVIRKSSGRAKGAAEALLRVFEEEMDAYESLLDARLSEIGFELPLPPDVDHLDLTQRAVRRLPPFNDDGGGYRDTLIWLTALQQVDVAPFDNLTVISDDGIFSRRSQDLQQELARETGAELTVARSLSSVEFPGEYESGIFDLSDLDIETSSVADVIRVSLPGLNISPWSPPGPDYAEVRQVGRVDLLEETFDVKKRYGSDLYEVGVEAIADIDAEVLIIHDAYGEEPDFSQMSARWNLHVRWRGECEADRRRPSHEGIIEVVGLEERRKIVR